MRLLAPSPCAVNGAPAHLSSVCVRYQDARLGAARPYDENCAASHPMPSLCKRARLDPRPTHTHDFADTKVCSAWLDVLAGVRAGRVGFEHHGPEVCAVDRSAVDARRARGSRERRQQVADGLPLRDRGHVAAPCPVHTCACVSATLLSFDITRRRSVVGRAPQSPQCVQRSCGPSRAAPRGLRTETKREPAHRSRQHEPIGEETSRLSRCLATLCFGVCSCSAVASGAWCVPRVRPGIAAVHGLHASATLACRIRASMPRSNIQLHERNMRWYRREFCRCRPGVWAPLETACVCSHDFVHTYPSRAWHARDRARHSSYLFFSPVGSPARIMLHVVSSCTAALRAAHAASF